MNSSKPLRRIASNYLFTGKQIVNHPLLTIHDTGRIVSIEVCVAPDRMPGVEFYPGILTPGLVNVHCHLELSYLRGIIAPGGGFAAFAQAMGKVRECAGEEERAAAIAAADARMWADGIAAVGDIANGDSSFGLKSRSRLHYRTFAEVFGLRTDSTAQQHRLLRHPLTSLTPHSIYSVQDALFREICTAGEAPLSIHFMETPAEAELFERRGDLWEWYGKVGFECDFLHYGSPARRIVESIPADRRVILVHNCYVTQQDIDLIMGHFTAPVWWCLCPGSNRYISRQRPPFELLRRNGLKICLGTDSLASNTTLSLLEEIKLLPEVPLPELLRWATASGAQALEWDEGGEVAIGRRPGLAVISGLDYNTMSLTNRSRIERIL